jgi:hypothetical protein
MGCAPPPKRHLSPLFAPFILARHKAFLRINEAKINRNLSDLEVKPQKAGEIKK